MTLSLPIMCIAGSYAWHLLPVWGLGEQFPIDASELGVWSKNFCLCGGLLYIHHTILVIFKVWSAPKSSVDGQEFCFRSWWV